MKFALTSDVHRGNSFDTGKIHERFFKKLQADSSWELLIVAGDIGISKTNQMKSFFKHIRQFIDRPILCVRGNHDYWHGPQFNARRSVKACDSLHKLFFKEYDIHHLEANPYVTNDVAFIGFDNWYQKHPVEMNCTDHEWMPHTVDGVTSTHEYLDRKAQRDLANCYSEATRYSETHKVVLTTHMPICELSLNKRHMSTYRPGAWDLFKKEIKVYCYGHVHQFRDELEDGVRLCSAPVHNDKPDYMLIEV